MADQTTTIIKGWKMTPLGEMGVAITGKTPSKDNPSDWGDFLDFITPTDIVSDSKYLNNVARKLSEDGANRFKKMIIPPKSVVVTCIGSDMGKVVMNRNEALTNQQINSIKIN
ncbi:MAG TPA: restriction endonuclease subunit S, partial [Candidatus Pacearchaeota archaeon]|nr:restriction endonuclease subunit S [Candidatus Pacearchaeota archaeon]